MEEVSPFDLKKVDAWKFCWVSFRVCWVRVACAWHLEPCFLPPINDFDDGDSEAESSSDDGIGNNSCGGSSDGEEQRQGGQSGPEEVECQYRGEMSQAEKDLIFCLRGRMNSVRKGSIKIWNPLVTGQSRWFLGRQLNWRLDTLFFSSPRAPLF